MMIEGFSVHYEGDKFPSVTLDIPDGEVPDYILKACYRAMIGRKLQETIAGFFPSKKGDPARLTGKNAHEHFVKLIMGEATRSRGEFTTNVIEIARRKLGKAYKDTKPVASGTELERQLHKKCLAVEAALADL